MANDPFRLRVMKLLCEAVKTVAPVNGYTLDLSDFTDTAGRPAERVFRGRTVFGENDPIPMIAILEDPSPTESNNDSLESGAGYNKFKILIQGFVKDDKDHPLDPAYLMSAEVIKAIVKSKAKRYDIMGTGNEMPCITNIKIGQPVHRPPDDEIANVSYFLVGVTLTLAENLEDPFS